MKSIAKVTYFENIPLLQNTLVPYFCEPEPLKSINKVFFKLNYEKYSAKARRRQHSFRTS
jgi:hypothetical protein